MTVPLLLYSLVGVGLFYFQNLLLFPQVRLRLLSLFVFCVGLRASFPLAFSLALVLGLLQDSFATTPFGLHLGSGLLLVGLARLCRRHLLWQKIGPQIAASLGALTLQELGFLLILLLLGFQPFPISEVVAFRGLELLGTAALTPLMSALVQGLEKFLSRHGWRSMRSLASE
jgi:rod shape-determining protein MreD